MFYAMGMMEAEKMRRHKYIHIYIYTHNFTCIFNETNVIHFHHYY